MIQCPVCEHQQAAGSECEVCGRRLAEGRGTDPAVPPMEGLEATAVGGGAGAGALPEAPVEGLEATRFEAAWPPLLEEPVPGLEATRAEPVEVAPDVTPDVERTQAGLPDDGPTPLPVTVVCRYCRTEARPGEVLCARCGMRLPRLAAAAPARVEAGPRLCSCGVPITGSLCPACGARNATE